MFQINRLENSNGESYTVLSQSGDNYLLLSPSEKTLILAQGWDAESASWANGKYYQNTPENLARATQALLGATHPEKYHKYAVEYFKELPYQDMFRALIEFEDPVFEGLSNVEFENLFAAWFRSDESGLMNMEPVYDALGACGIEEGYLSQRKTSGNRIFVDMDGVIAEYRPCKTMETLYRKGYFASLAPMEQVIEGLKEYMLEYPQDQVYILSAVLSDSPTAYSEKMDWLDKHFNIPRENRIFCPCGENKADFIPGGIQKNDVLLDDYTVNLVQWERAGGTAIKVMNGLNGTKGQWQGARIYADETFDLKNSLQSPPPRQSEKGYSL